MAIQIVSDGTLAQVAAAPLAKGMQSALVDALSGWAEDRQGLGGRLSAGAWAIYGWTARSPGYQRRQLRGQWGVLPYVSPPRRKSYGGIGKFLFSLTRKGVGHNVYAGPVSDVQSEATLTVAAARGLNFSRAGGVYLDEWGRVYPADEAGIMARALPRADRAVQEELDRG